MKRIIIFLITGLVSFCFWISCNKPGTDSPRDQSPTELLKVRIDSIQLLGFEDVLIAASFENPNSDSISKKGFCWSTTQNPDINDNKSDIAPTNVFSDTIYALGKKTTIFFRAYVQTSDSIFYSENATIATGGLDDDFFTDVNDGTRRHIWQVIETPDNQLMQFIIVVGQGINWPQLIKMDRAGNILWKKDYYVNQRVFPDQIFNVADGYLFATTKVVNPNIGIGLTKIDFNGELVWEKTFIKKTYQQLIRCVKVPGNLAKLTMFSYDGHSASGKTNCSMNEFIVDLSGNLVSEKTVPVNNSITLNTDWLGADITGEGFFMSANYYTGTLPDQLAVQKYDSALHLEWEKIYRKADVSGPAAVSLSPAGDYNILALIEQSGIQNTWMMEIDKGNGNLRWDFTYDVNNNELPISNFGKKFIVDASGNYYIFGRMSDPAYPGANLFVLKLSSKGKKVWHYPLKMPKAGDVEPEAILKQGNEIYLFGAFDDQQAIGTNTLFMKKLIEN